MNKYYIFLLPFLALGACNDDDDNKLIEPDNSDSTKVVVYTAPAYADDYSAISAWDLRASWNLANVHDPSVVKCGDYYYMYGTDASYGNAHDGHGHYPSRRSKDLVNWEYRGAAMAGVPSWVADTLNNMRSRLGLPAITAPSYGFWAPVVRKISENRYRMYYSIVVDNFIGNGLNTASENFDNTWTEHAFIGMAEASSLADNIWVDRGMVVCSSTDRATNWARESLSNYDAYFKYNAIDPSFIITPEGEHWLIYGSWHSGIVALQLDPETGKPINELGESWAADAPAKYGTIISSRNSASRWQASEAPEIIYHNGYYYLFLAYDELSVAYNTRVVRAENITGPYLDITGRNTTNGRGDCYPVLTHPYAFNNHSGWVGFSHCCVFEAENDYFYASQARLPAGTNGNDYANAIMMGHVRKIRWTESGWPVVMPERYAAVPDSIITAADLVGEWEIITLRYSWQNQQTSETLTLNANNSATGALTGTWSYDAENKVLHIGDQDLCIERELDWEATPRVPTIIFAGLDKANDEKFSLWGKKK